MKTEPFPFAYVYDADLCGFRRRSALDYAIKAASARFEARLTMLDGQCGELPIKEARREARWLYRQALACEAEARWLTVAYPETIV